MPEQPLACIDYRQERGKPPKTPVLPESVLNWVEVGIYHGLGRKMT